MNVSTDAARAATSSARRPGIVNPFIAESKPASAPADGVTLGTAAPATGSPAAEAAPQAATLSPLSRAASFCMLGLAGMGAFMAMPAVASAAPPPHFSQSMPAQFHGQSQWHAPVQQPQWRGQTQQQPQWHAPVQQQPQWRGQTQQQPQWRGQTQQQPQWHGQTQQQPQWHGQTQQPQWHGQTQQPQWHGQTQQPQWHGQTQQPQWHGQTQQQPQWHGQTQQQPQWHAPVQQQPQWHGQTQQPQWHGQPGGWQGRPQFPQQNVHIGNQQYHVPQGGWVTNAHRHNPGINTVVIHERPMIVNRPVVVRNYFDNWYGPGWGHERPWGFYHGSDFWMGYTFGALLGGAYNPMVQPVYVYSPVSQCQVGVLQPPMGTGTFNSERDVQLAVLTAMSHPTAEDPSAGLYAANPYDGESVGPRVTVAYAYNQLAKGQPVYFHPSNGAYEKIGNLDELQTYVYARESQAEAPSQQFEQPQ